MDISVVEAVTAPPGCEGAFRCLVSPGLVRFLVALVDAFREDCDEASTIYKFIAAQSSHLRSCLCGDERCKLPWNRDRLHSGETTRSTYGRMQDGRSTHCQRAFLIAEWTSVCATAALRCPALPSLTHLLKEMCRPTIVLGCSRHCIAEHRCVA
jgi:hypothetical protein